MMTPPHTVGTDNLTDMLLNHPSRVGLMAAMPTSQASPSRSRAQRPDHRQSQFPSDLAWDTVE